LGYFTRELAIDIVFMWLRESCGIFPVGVRAAVTDSIAGCDGKPAEVTPYKVGSMTIYRLHRAWRANQ
jgi:hypothetical protein